MPWAMHADLLSMYWRAHLITEYGLWGLPTNQILGHYMYAANLWIMKLAGFDLRSLFELPFGLSVGSSTSSVGDWLRFIENPRLNSALFFMKVPHLLFDLGSLWIIWKIMQQLPQTIATYRQHILVLSLWWLNPVTIFAFYLFSRHDAITSFFVLLAMSFTIQQKKLLISFLSLFAAIQVRVQPLLFIPLFIISWWRNRPGWKQLLKQIAIGIGILVLYLLLVRSLPFNPDLLDQIHGRDSGSLVSSPAIIGIPQNHSRQVSEGKLFGIPIFFVAYLLLILAVALLKKITLKDLTLALTVCMSIYFAVNPFSPHYFVWLMPPAVLAVVFIRRFQLPLMLSILWWGIAALFKTDQYAISQHLFLPVSYDLFLTPSLAGIWDARGGFLGIQSQNIARAADSMLSLSLVVMALLAARELWSGSSRRVALPNWQLSSWWKFLQKVIVGAICAGIVFHATTSTPAHAALVPVLESSAYTNDLILTEVSNSSLQVDSIIIQQIIPAPDEPVGAVAFRFNTFRQTNKHQLRLSIKPLSTPEWHYQAFYDTSDFYNRHFYPFGFPPLRVQAGTPLLIEMQIVDSNASGVSSVISSITPLALGIHNDPLPGTKLLINSVELKGQSSSFWLGSEKPSSFLIDSIYNAVLQKIVAQQMFFKGYLALLIVVTVALGVVVFSNRRDNQ
jgi:hypothetical protein